MLADPAPPHWGGNASLYAWSANVNMTNPSDAPLHPHWTFNYSYDWTLSASRYDHAQGQHDEVCKMAVTPGDPCTVLNALDGMLYLLGPASCCRCDALWAPVTIVPDWLARSNATYEGRSSLAAKMSTSGLRTAPPTTTTTRRSTRRASLFATWNTRTEAQAVGLLRLAAGAPPRSVFVPPPAATRSAPPRSAIRKFNFIL